MNDIDEIECRKMVAEMLATDDRGFSDRQIDILDSLSKQNFAFTVKQRAMIENIYKEKM